jgi:anti-sigma regulatory factor (Ser/Thr protein kinase)
MFPNTAAAETRRWSFDATDPRAAHAARRTFVEYLRSRYGSSIDECAAELVFGELTGNVARYAPGTVEVAVEPCVGAMILHVIDRGAGFVPASIGTAEPFDENGRGLMLVAALTRSFDVECRPEGCHVRAVLPVVDALAL